MGEKATSAADAVVLHAGISSAIEALEKHGFTKGEIGAAMAGIGLGLVEVHLGQAAAHSLVKSIGFQMTFFPGNGKKEVPAPPPPTTVRKGGTP